MKVKKLLALVLSAIMAVSMLTACGGGGGGGGSTGGGGVSAVSLNYNTINADIKSQGYNEKVGALPELTKAVTDAATLLSEYNASDIAGTSLGQIVVNAMGGKIGTGPFSFAMNRQANLISGGYEKMAAHMAVGYIKQLGNTRTYYAAVSEFNSKDNVPCYVMVVFAAV